MGTRVCEPMFESKTEEEMGMLLSDKLGLDTKQLYPIDEKQQFFNKLVGSTMLTEDTHEVVPLFTITQEDIDSMERGRHPSGRRRIPWRRYSRKASTR